MGEASGLQRGALARKLEASKDDIIGELFRRMQVADDACERETAATVRIQSCWRAHVLRLMLREWNGNALLVGRVYRGHLGRLLVNAARRERDIYRQRVYFSLCATSIQKWFRAHHSRRHKHDFYARKAYIASVLGASEALRRQLNESLQAQVEEAIASQERTARESLATLSVKLHHLVSTKTMAGIYNSPYGEVPTAFAIPVEQHLREAIKPQVREELRRSAKGRLTNTKPRLSPAAAARGPEPRAADERARGGVRAAAVSSETRRSDQPGSPHVDGATRQSLSSLSSKPFQTSVLADKLLESQ